MSIEVVRWGVLSTAQIAQSTMIPAIQAAKNAEVQAIASGNSKVAAVAEKFSIPKVYYSYDELLDDPEIDAVYIPLPNSLHKEWVIKSANKGKHILCEKPVALSASEAAEMIEACEKNNVNFMEAFMYQFHPQHQVVKEIISSGEIGEVKLMRSNFSFILENKVDDIRVNPELGGGSLYDVGCYCIHSIRGILNTELKKIFVQGNFDPVKKVDMSAIGVFELDNGILASFDCSFDMTRRERYEIVGTKGTIQVPRAYNLPDYFNGEAFINIEYESGNIRTEKVSGHQYTLEIDDFSQSIIDGVQPMYSGESILQNMRMIEECYKSMKTGKWIDLS